MHPSLLYGTTSQTGAGHLRCTEERGVGGTFGEAYVHPGFMQFQID
jgi:hypothetical protein